MNKKILVVDLDGTLYSINTFHYFIKFLIYEAIKKLDFLFLLNILAAVTYRGVKLISHSKMKFLILEGIKNKEYMDFRKFVNNISPYKRNISVVNEDLFDLKILATAAPSCYANIIAKNEGFDVCLGTNFPLSDFNEEFENIKDVKKNTVLNYLSKVEDYELDTFITDHIDDIPLMKYANKNIIINPDFETKKELKKHLISFEILFQKDIANDCT